MIAPAGRQPPHYRAATLSFDDEAAMRMATREAAVAQGRSLKAAGSLRSLCKLPLSFSSLLKPSAELWIT